MEEPRNLQTADVGASACCAHSRVVAKTTRRDDGYIEGHWECDSCETQFLPERLYRIFEKEAEEREAVLGIIRDHRDMLISKIAGWGSDARQVFHAIEALPPSEQKTKALTLVSELQNRITIMEHPGANFTLILRAYNGRITGAAPGDSERDLVDGELEPAGALLSVFHAEQLMKIDAVHRPTHATLSRINKEPKLKGDL